MARRARNTPRPTRVGLCFGTFPPERNGGADFVARFSAALAALGIEVAVVTSAREGAPAVEQLRPGVTVHRVVEDWGLGRAGRTSLALANDVLAEAGSQLVHVFFPDSVLQGRYRLPALLGAGRLPLVTTFWNLGLGRRSPAAVRLEALALLARSGVVSSHDPTYLRVLRRTIGRVRPTAWLPAGNNLAGTMPSGSQADLRGELGMPDVEWLGYFGQLDATRGVEDLFEALALVRRNRDVRLVMIGSAGRAGRYDDEPESARYLRDVLALPERHGVGDAVVWTEYLPDATVLRYLCAVDLCVLPYRRNSLGRSALATALQLGRPVVLAGTPAGIEPLRPGRDVALIPPRSPAELAATVERLLADPAERARLAEGARAAAVHFSWPRIAERAAEMYERALER